MLSSSLLPRFCNLTHNPTQLKRKRTQNSTDLNLYIPEKWY